MDRFLKSELVTVWTRQAPLLEVARAGFGGQHIEVSDGDQVRLRVRALGLVGGGVVDDKGSTRPEVWLFSARHKLEISILRPHKLNLNCHKDHIMHSLTEGASALIVCSRVVFLFFCSRVVHRPTTTTSKI